MTKEEAKSIAENIIAVGKKEKWYKRWRNLALLLLVVMLYQAFSSPSAPVDNSHIAMINVDEVITQDSLFWEQFERINPIDTKAVLILMNSPGGAVGDSERLYNEIAAIQARFPTALLVENSATSGGYLGSLGADKIYAYNTSVIGSIGVVLKYWSMKELMDSFGIKEEMITTGRNKGYPSRFQETPDRVKQNLQALLDSDNEWFLSLVEKRRGLDRQSLDAIRDAQVYNARDALKLGLIDGISSRQEQINALREQVGPLPIKDMSIDEDDIFGLSKLLQTQRKSFAKVAQSFLNYLT